MGIRHGRTLAVAAVGFLLLSAEGPKEKAPFVRVSAPVVALIHVNVIDGSGAPGRDDQTLVIAGGKISAMGEFKDIKVPEGADVLDLKGDTVFPGLVGMHDHMYYPAPGASPPLYQEHGMSFPTLYLAGGVTSIRTTGSVEPYTDLEIKRGIDEGKLIGPKMHLSGPYLEGEGAYTPQMHQLKDAQDARRTVEYWVAEGITSFKAYMHITPDELGAAVQAAHAHHLTVTGHLCSIGFREAAALGIDDLEHGLVVDTEFFSGKKPGVCPDQRGVLQEMAEKLSISDPRVQETIKDLVARHVAITSTLPVFETFVPNRAPTDARVLEAMLPEARIAYLTRRAAISDAAAKSPWPALLKKEFEFERAFSQAGGLLLAGLDPTGFGGVIPGFGDQREVELLVEAGFTPLEAIHVATANGAQFLGESASIGTLALGKAADIVVVRGDPAKSISDIEKVEIVFKDGVGYDSQKLIASVKGTVGLD